MHPAEQTGWYAFVSLTRASLPIPAEAGKGPARRAITLSVPCRYVHTITETVHTANLGAAVNPFSAWLRGCSAEHGRAATCSPPAVHPCGPCWSADANTS
jgi:hypothetical protein